MNKFCFFFTEESNESFGKNAENVSQKAIDSAKSLGSNYFFLSLVYTIFKHLLFVFFLTKILFTPWFTKQGKLYLQLQNISNIQLNIM